jgi:uncharacterized membrane protein YdjX (TVP38/TMEM64 family)
MVTPREQSGRLEQHTMGAFRMQQVSELRKVDAHGRLRVVYPVVGGITPVNVHSKVMIVDDRLLRVGSANLSTRSQRLDTECDATIEALDARTAEAVASIRNRLVGEHLGVEPREVARMTAATGSLVRTMDRLQGGERTVRLLEVDDADDGSLAIQRAVADPDRAMDEALMRYAVPDEVTSVSKGRIGRLGAIAAGILVLSGLWLWTPLGQWADPSRLAALTAPVSDGPWGIAIGTVGFAVASLLMVPVTVLIVAAVMIYGPWSGFLFAVLGSLLSSIAGYGVGRSLFRDAIRRLAGPRLNRISRALAKRGVLTVAFVRLVPVAPFSVVNMVAGSSRVGLRDFLSGTLVGMVPGIAVYSFASDRVIEAARDPSPLTLAIALLSVGALLGLIRWGTGLVSRTWDE